MKWAHMCTFAESVSVLCKYLCGYLTLYMIRTIARVHLPFNFASDWTVGESFGIFWRKILNSYIGYFILCIRFKFLGFPKVFMQLTQHLKWEIFIQRGFDCNTCQWNSACDSWMYKYTVVWTWLFWKIIYFR